MPPVSKEKKSTTPKPQPELQPELQPDPDTSAPEPRSSGSGFIIPALGFLMLVVMVAANMKC